jgi:hypothetical protein
MTLTKTSVSLETLKCVLVIVPTLNAPEPLCTTLSPVSLDAGDALTVVDGGSADARAEFPVDPGGQAGYDGKSNVCFLCELNQATQDLYM